MGILGQGVGRRKPLNLGGKWKIPRRKTQGGVGRGRRVGEAGNPNYSWEGSLPWIPCPREGVVGYSLLLSQLERLSPATRLGLQLFLVTHTAWGPTSCRTSGSTPEAELWVSHCGPQTYCIKLK